MRSRSPSPVERNKRNKRKYPHLPDKTTNNEPDSYEHGTKITVRDSIASTTLTSEVTNNAESVSTNLKCYGPTLPPPSSLQANEVQKSEIYGPSLPKSYSNKSYSQSNNVAASELRLPKVYGPLLPPGSSHKLFTQADNAPPDLKLPINASDKSDKFYDPVTPSTSVPNLSGKESFQNNPFQSCGEQMLPENIQQSRVDPQLSSIGSLDDESYGPLPPNSALQSKAHIALEERALQMKLDSLQKDRNDHAIREEWMIELPEVRSRNLGLGPRQFRPNAGPDFSDRSSWTDTPREKAKKTEGTSSKVVDLKSEAKIKGQQKYDQEQEKIIKKHKKSKKEKTLMEIHQEKMKQKKKDEGTERRPFNREIDLKVNHFDEAQKKSILKKAQLLDDRFSKGQSKYL